MNKIISVTPLKDYIVSLTFDDGSTKEIDFLPLLTEGRFTQLKQNPELFSKFKVDMVGERLYWDNIGDIPFESIYQQIPSPNTIFQVGETKSNSVPKNQLSTSSFITISPYILIPIGIILSLGVATLRYQMKLADFKAKIEGANKIQSTSINYNAANVASNKQQINTNELKQMLYQRKLNECQDDGFYYEGPLKTDFDKTNKQLDPNPNYFAFSYDDFNKKTVLVKRLQQNDEVSTYIRANLSSSALTDLSFYRDTEQPKTNLIMNIVDAFNKTLLNPQLNELSKRISTDRIKKIIEKNPSGKGFVYLNRITLEDSLPDLINKTKYTAVSCAETPPEKPQIESIMPESSKAKTDELKESQIKEPENDIPLYAASFFVLLAISFISMFQLKEILEESKPSRNRWRANFIAVIIGLAIIVMLFKQSFLEQLFGSFSTKDWLRAILGIGSITIGWLAWYLKQIKSYGEFFHILLLAVTIGLCWYARLTDIEEVQLTAVCFLLGSLFHIAKDYLDAQKKEEQKSELNNTLKNQNKNSLVVHNENDEKSTHKPTS